MILLALILILSVAMFLAMLIASAVKKMLVRSQNKYTNGLSIFTFVFSFIVIFCAACLLIVYYMGAAK
ncbi:hypothetical protein [Mucilaginibacter sp.]|uniref:hypothetical protein n=1 Tax=Mucilaginibacter sp. TaxID=1882438 RepID=UPI003267AA25